MNMDQSVTRWTQFIFVHIYYYSFYVFVLAGRCSTLFLMTIYYRSNDVTCHVREDGPEMTWESTTRLVSWRTNDDDVILVSTVF